MGFQLSGLDFSSFFFTLNFGCKRSLIGSLLLSIFYLVNPISCNLKMQRSEWTNWREFLTLKSTRLALNGGWTRWGIFNFEELLSGIWRLMLLPWLRMIIRYGLPSKFSKYMRTLDFTKMNYKRRTRRENKTKIVIS